MGTPIPSVKPQIARRQNDCESFVTVVTDFASATIAVIVWIFE